MKQTVAVFLTLACFALAIECQIYPHPHQDLRIAFHYTTDRVDNLTRQFEIAATSGDKAQLEAILAESQKQLPANISTLQYDIKEAISRLSNFEEHAFGRRLTMEADLVQITGKARQLKAVQLEALGITSGVAQLPHYQFSDLLALELSYIVEHHSTFLVKIYQVDQILEEARKKQNQNDTAAAAAAAHILDPATKVKVLKLLKEIGTSLATVKSKLADKYYSVVEEMRLKNEELGLKTRFEVEFAIDVTNLAQHYAAEISQMIEKYGSASPKLMNFLMKF